MASADYKPCNVCGCKTFYDANLDYDFEEYNKNTGLYNTAQLISICNECSNENVAVIVKKKKKDKFLYEQF
jgi:hypothetical protein